MGWVEDQFENQDRTNASARAETQAEATFEARAARKWNSLLTGFEQDAEEYRQLNGTADFTRLSEFECRISNAASSTAARVTADLSAHTIDYSYEPEAKSTAVPEGGVLSLRDSGNSVDLYSADQRVTAEQARRLILEPLLFPSKPLPQEAPLKKTGS